LQVKNWGLLGIWGKYGFKQISAKSLSFLR
jgi:hypothetical protein